MKMIKKIMKIRMKKKMMMIIKKKKKSQKGLKVSLKKDLETLQNQKLEAY